MERGGSVCVCLYYIHDDVNTVGLVVVVVVDGRMDGW